MLTEAFLEKAETALDAAYAGAKTLYSWLGREYGVKSIWTDIIAFIQQILAGCGLKSPEEVLAAMQAQTRQACYAQRQAVNSVLFWRGISLKHSQALYDAVATVFSKTATIDDVTLMMAA